MLQLFTFLLGLVYFKSNRAEIAYNYFICLVKGIQISCNYTISKVDLTDMEQPIFKFNEHYKRHHYKLE